jgi:hypothetical protein
MQGTNVHGAARGAACEARACVGWAKLDGVAAAGGGDTAESYCLIVMLLTVHDARRLAAASRVAVVLPVLADRYGTTSADPSATAYGERIHKNRLHGLTAHVYMR